MWQCTSPSASLFQNSRSAHACLYKETKMILFLCIVSNRTGESLCGWTLDAWVKPLFTCQLLQLICPRKPSAPNKWSEAGCLLLQPLEQSGGPRITLSWLAPCSAHGKSLLSHCILLGHSHHGTLKESKQRNKSVAQNTYEHVTCGSEVCLWKVNHQLYLSLSGFWNKRLILEQHLATWYWNNKTYSA